MVKLIIVTRENWKEALNLTVADEQKGFVPTVAVSLSKVYIKPDGDNVEYIPFAIYDQHQMVGFVMHAYEEKTTDSYWINGFFIDHEFQGKGFGKAALSEMIQWITERHPRCEVIRLTVDPDNEWAKKLYVSSGFQPTDLKFGEEVVYQLPVNGGM
ncbi:GNAT family N-acetyltransferase [Chungangia koreensis]|uniref:GNAT family N-acetyltransferase n=1 Tax=Chungangia koreensis TaxID=752657 RepID=A0ABV8WYV9_9LACT